MVAVNFNRSLKALLVHEGGNDDDPEDPGGRTSRGITQREYNVWRVTRGLPMRDVWTADDVEVRAIYHDNYWQVIRADDLPSGVEYCTFDYGVNSGDGRADRQLQIIVGSTPDGLIGPKTLAAAAAKDPAFIINALCDERLAFLRDLRTWPRFGGGWGTRVTEVRAMSLAMISEKTGASA